MEDYVISVAFCNDMPNLLREIFRSVGNEIVVKELERPELPSNIYWAANDRCLIHAIPQAPSMRLYRAKRKYNFTPTFDIVMDFKGTTVDLEWVTYEALRLTLPVLKHTTGDLVLEIEYDFCRLLRKDGLLYLNDSSIWTADMLALIDLPYERKPLPPE